MRKVSTKESKNRVVLLRLYSQSNFSSKFFMNCTQFKSCADCTSEHLNCGWCGNSKSNGNCMQGDWRGPSTLSNCGHLTDWYWAQCSGNIVMLS